MRKMASKQKNQGPQSRMKNKTHFTLWVIDADVQNCLIVLMSLLITKHDLSFQIVVSKFEGWKWRDFYGRPQATFSLATPLIVY